MSRRRDHLHQSSARGSAYAGTLPWWWTYTPLLLRPRVATIIRGSRSSAETPGNWAKNGLLVTFASVLLFGLLESTTSALQQLSVSVGRAEVSPLVPLEVLFSVLLVLLFLSSFVAALSSLLLAHDVDFLLSSPVSPRVMFLGKLFDIGVVSSWFPLLLILPMLLGLAIFFHAPTVCYLAGFLVVLLFVLLTSASAMLIVTTLGWIIPPERLKTIVVFIGLGALIAAYLFFPWHLSPEVMGEDVGAILAQILQDRLALGQSSSHWIPLNPSHGAAQMLSHLYAGNFSAMSYSSLALIAFVFTVVLLSMELSPILFQRARRRGGSAATVFRINGRRSQHFVRVALALASAPTRALIAKEIKLFSRDIVQALQLMVLLGLCVVYLYNFQILRVAGEHADLKEGVRLWWEGILVVLNILVGAIVTATVCMRFVFPSISMEGKGMWLLQSAPLESSEILKAKFWCWFVPLATIMSVVMISGGFAIQAEPRIIAVSGMVSWIYCYGIVGLAVGLGAVFSNFSWDHPAQVTAGVGAVFYFFASALLVAVAGFPTAGLVVLRTLREQGVEFSSFHWGVLVVSASAMLVYIHILAHRWAMRMGSAALNRLRELPRG